VRPRRTVESDHHDVTQRLPYSSWRRHQTPLAAIVGEVGVGKSRLVSEFTHSHRLQGWLVLESTWVSYGKATSYLPVIDLRMPVVDEYRVKIVRKSWSLEVDG
jgi:AAA ATPase domain